MFSRFPKPFQFSRGNRILKINFYPNFPSRNILTIADLPQNVLDAQYAVRGPLVVRAVEIEKALKKGEKFPFQRITYCNVC